MHIHEGKQKHSMELKHCLDIKLFKLLIIYSAENSFFLYLTKCLHEFYKLFIKCFTNKSIDTD